MTATATEVAPLQFADVPEGHVELMVIRSIFNKAGRERRLVPTPRTLEDLLDEPGLEHRAHFIIDGKARELDFEPPDRCRIVGMHVPAGPIVPIIITAIISAVVAIGVNFLANLLFGDDPQQPNRDSSSPTYGWGGIRNTRTQGSPIPRIYGEHRVGGQILGQWRETVDEFNNLQTLYLIIGLGSGPLNRIGQYTTDQNNLTGAALPEGLRLNGLDAKTYNPGTLGVNGVTAWVRMGTQDQAPLGHPFTNVKQLHTVDVLITTDWTVYVAREPIQGIDLNLSFPRGLFDASSGSFNDRTVTIEVEISSDGGQNWAPYVDSPYTFGGPGDGGTPTSTAFVRTIKRPFTVPPQSPGDVDVQVRIRRTTAQSSVHDIGDVVRLQDALEYPRPFAYFTEPNHRGIGLIALAIDATEQLSGGTPLVTIPVEGRDVPIVTSQPAPDRPTLEYRFSRNPAWIALDILLDKDDGLGNFLTLDDIDVPSFEAFAAYCNETVQYTDREIPAGGRTRLTETVEPGSATVVILDDFTNVFVPGTFVEVEREGITFITQRDDLGGGRFRLRLADPIVSGYPAGWELELVILATPTNEVRAYFDGTFDQPSNAWEAIQQVCRAGFGIPTRVGRKIAIRIEQEGDPVQILSDAHMIADSLTIDYSSAAKNVNSVEVQFLNAAKDYDQDVAPATRSPRFDQYVDNPEQVAGYGITRYTHAKRRANYEMKVRELIGRRATFRVPADAVALEPGDVIGIASTLPDWTVATSRARGTLDAFTIDRDIELEAGVTYSALVVTPEDRAPQELTITNPAGTIAAGTTITTDGPTTPIDERQPVSIGRVNNQVRLFRVVEIGLEEDLTVEVKAAEYNPAAYASVPDRAAPWIEPPVIPPACLSPGVSYFADLTADVEALCETCAPEFQCADDDGICSTPCRLLGIDVDVSGPGAGCVVIEDVTGGGVIFRLEPGCEDSTICLDWTLYVIREPGPDCNNGVQICNTSGPPQCSTSGQVCFTTCPA